MTDLTRLPLLCAISAAVGAATVLLACRSRAAPDVPAPPPPPAPPTITVWLTKDLLGDQITFADTPRDDGVIAECRVPDPAPNEILTIARRTGNGVSFRPYGPGEWHRTREAAVAAANRMRAARVATLREEIGGLEAMNFQEGGRP